MSHHRERVELEIFGVSTEAAILARYVGGGVLQRAKISLTELEAASVPVEKQDGSLNFEGIAQYIVAHRPDAVEIVNTFGDQTRAFERYRTQLDESLRNENHYLLVATIMWLINNQESQDSEAA